MQVGITSRLVASVALVALLTSTGWSTNVAASPVNRKQLLIGWTSLPFTIPALADARSGAELEAKKKGNVKIVYAPAADAPTQLTAVQNLLAQKVNVLAIDVNDSRAILPAIKQANQAHVPVIIFVSPAAASAKVATTVITPDFQGGEQITNWVSHRVKSGKVALLQGAKSNEAGFHREQGVRKELAKFHHIQLAGYAEGQWVRDTGEIKAADLLTRTPDLKAIISLNDEMALGALQAAQSRGLAGKVLITGYNGECEALRNIWNNGGLSATLYQPFRDIGKTIVDSAIKASHGKKLPKITNMPQIVMDKTMMSHIRQAKKYHLKVSVGVRFSVNAAIKGCK